MNHSRALSLFLPIALLVPGLLAADVVPASRQLEIAPPFTQVPPGARYRHLSASAVAAGSQGFVVAWDDDFYDPNDFESPSGSSTGCWLLSDGRRTEGLFDNDDLNIEGNTGTTLARIGDTRAVAVWETWDWRNVSAGFKVLDLEGQLTQGSSLRLSEYAEGLYDAGPAVASSGQGTFVIAWTRQDQTLRTMARVFASDGAPMTPEIDVSGPIPGSIWNVPDSARNVAVGMAADGSFVAVWLDVLEANALHPIWGRRFDRDGQPLGERFRLGATSGGVAMAMRPTGEFVAAWQAPVQRDVLLLSRFAADGRRLGNAVRVRGAIDPALAMEPSGRVALFWLEARRPALLVFGATLGRLSPVLYDPPASRDPYRGHPGVAFAADGRILTVWTGPRGAKAKDSVLGRIWQVR